MIELMNHQRTLVSSAADSPEFRRLLLEWSPGVGKTIACLARIADAKAGGFAGKTLVIAPLSVLRSAWANDARHFPTLKVAVCHGYSAAKRKKLLQTPGADVLVINPDSFKSHYMPWKGKDDISSLGITRLIFDESDKLQDSWSFKKDRRISGSDIAAATYLFSQTCAEVYLLSGTPTSGREIDYYGQVRCLDPDLFGTSFYKFANEWFIAEKKQVGYTPRGELIPFMRAARIPYRKVCHYRDIAATMSGLHGYFCRREGLGKWFPDGKPSFELAALLRAAGTPQAAYDGETTLTFLESRLRYTGNKDLFFAPFEAVAGYKLLDARKEDFYRLLGRRVWVLRRDECLDLPGETDCVREVYLSSGEWGAYTTLRDELRMELGDGSAGVDVEGSSKWIKLRQIPGGTVKILDERKRLGDSKIEALMDLLHELGQAQVVIFAEFTGEIDRIVEALADAGANVARIDGSVAAEDRDEYQARFRDGTLQYLVCHPAAAGHGLNLQTACYDVFYSLGANPRLHEQARARIYRKGQSRPVTHYYLTAAGTVDEQMFALTKGKISAAEAIKQTLAAGQELECVA